MNQWLFNKSLNSNDPHALKDICRSIDIVTGYRWPEGPYALELQREHTHTYTIHHYIYYVHLVAHGRNGSELREFPLWDNGGTIRAHCYCRGCCVLCYRFYHRIFLEMWKFSMWRNLRNWGCANFWVWFIFFSWQKLMIFIFE